MVVPCPSPALPKSEMDILYTTQILISDLGRVPERREGLNGFISYCNQHQLLLLQHILRIQLPRRTGVTAEAFVHILALHLERDEQVFVRGVGVHAELGGIGKETSQVKIILLRQPVLKSAGTSYPK